MKNSSIESKKPLWVVTGPTGSGKSDLAEKICGQTKKVYFNADVFQCFQEIPILSNQPTSIRVENFFIGDRSLSSPISAGSFSREATSHLHRPGVWVGVGLYLGAVLYGLDPERPKGTPFRKAARRSYRMIVINPDRDALYRSLNHRVDQMILNGAVEEAETILRRINGEEIPKNQPALKAIGLRQLLQFLSGEISKENSIESWKQETRRLAKRQWTWLRKFCPPSEYCDWQSAWTLGEAMKSLSSDIKKP